jgi:hypothetical protein
MKYDGLVPWHWEREHLKCGDAVSALPPHALDSAPLIGHHWSVKVIRISIMFSDGTISSLCHSMN